MTLNAGGAGYSVGAEVFAGKTFPLEKGPSAPYQTTGVEPPEGDWLLYYYGGVNLIAVLASDEAEFLETEFGKGCLKYGCAKRGIS